LQFVQRRIESISRLAAEKNYAIHLTGAELDGLPKGWAGKPILRPEVDPTLGTKPLPLIHDLVGFAYFPPSRLTDLNR
jgi:hypothetical protein